MGAKSSETDKVLEILKNKSMELKGNTLDISAELEKHKETEYRAEDISKITLGENNTKPCKVKVMDCGSGDVPFIIEDKVCVLCFASSLHPGGGFLTGAHAQEENLCYHSNLYEIISKHENFYEFNKDNQNKGLYEDGIIYCEDVLFFRKGFKNIQPILADVIVCAAPNKGRAVKNGVKSPNIDATMTRRLEQILKVAIKHEVKTLVLGAFGCGVFKNDVEYVATETKKLLYMKGYARYFDKVIFPCMSKTDRVYREFDKTFQGWQ